MQFTTLFVAYFAALAVAAPVDETNTSDISDSELNAAAESAKVSLPKIYCTPKYDGIKACAKSIKDDAGSCGLLLTGNKNPLVVAKCADSAYKLYKKHKNDHTTDCRKCFDKPKGHSE